MQDLAGLGWDALGWEMAQDPGESPQSGFRASGRSERRRHGSLHFKQGTDDFMQNS